MKKPNLPAGAHVHMVGVGGAGVSALAVIMAGLGYRVSGSDRNPADATKKLTELGVEVLTGHKGEHVTGAELVVASAAIPDDNPEIQAAKENGIPVIQRAEMLGRLMSGNCGIAVAGTHGKTTTTSMLAVVLESAKLDPTILIGGHLDQIGGNAKLGGSEIFLTEACEAFRSFLSLAPKIAIVTNVEADHLDCYGSLDGVKESFRHFLSQVKPGGLVVACVDCENVPDVLTSVSERVVTYGISESAELRAVDVDVSTPSPKFRAVFGERDLGEFVLNVPGMHNVLNALAVLAVGMELGVSVDAMRESLLLFHGAGRRFDVLGTAGGITVVDDYAHHPTEIAATLSAARAWGRRVVAVFQPHLFSRTKLLADDFAESLSAADDVIVTEVYPAREEPIPGVSGSMIVDRINVSSPGRARFVADKMAVAGELSDTARSGDIVVVMGAGDIRASAEVFFASLTA